MTQDIRGMKEVYSEQFSKNTITYLYVMNEKYSLEDVPKNSPFNLLKMKLDRKIFLIYLLFHLRTCDAIMELDRKM